MIEEGSDAPDFTLETTGGTKSLGDYRGRTLVLYFYPKDDTSGCTTEAQAFTELAAEFAQNGADILAISKDNIATHRKFIEKYDLGIDLGSDPEGETIAAYGSWIEKNMYGRKYMGIDRSTFLIDGDGMIRRIWRKVKVSGHAVAVLHAVRDLG